jgi:hypothetical protein
LASQEPLRTRKIKPTLEQNCDKFRLFDVLQLLSREASQALQRGEVDPMSTMFDRDSCLSASIAKQPTAPENAEDESDISALIDRLTAEVNQIACEKTRSIQNITNQMKMLALNALIESSRAGVQGAGFAVVAQEVRNVGQQVEAIARELETQLTKRTGNLMNSIKRMTERSRGDRMVDLALNAIELIDRNLYERTCDVRWWATDSAVVDCAATPDAATISHVSDRMAVILGAYTVYLDLWLCDLEGKVLANGRANRFNVVGQNVAATKWFREALNLRSGDDYVAGDVECQPLLGNAQVATYCASVRAGGKAHGKPIGVLAIHFDWEPQARAIVQGVRVDAADKARVLLVDSNFRVIAASDRNGLLTERIPLSLEGRRSGFYQDRSGTLTAFHATPGYETYKGLGWFGMIVCAT